MAAAKTQNKHGKLIGQQRAAWSKEFTSSFKGLNAHRASAKAYENASPNSQVGAIAAYAAAEQALRDATQDAVDAQSLVDAALASLQGNEEGQFGLSKEDLDVLRGYDNPDTVEVEAPTAEQIATDLSVDPDQAAAIAAAYGDLISAESGLATAEGELQTAQQTADDAWGGAARQGQDEALRDVLNDRLEARGLLSDPSTETETETETATATETATTTQ